MDKLCLATTAEGAAHEIHTILLRMRELAVQAANGTAAGGGDRAALKSEFDALEAEINRMPPIQHLLVFNLLMGHFLKQPVGSTLASKRY